MKPIPGSVVPPALTQGASPALAPDPLAGLRPYHLPDPVGWWPPAPGWWLLALVVLAAAVGLVWWWRRRRRARAASLQAERELEALCGAFAADGDALALARGCSRLLRRLAVVRFGRAAAAGLAGEAWLAFLDARGGGETFRFGVGRALLDAPYRHPHDGHRGTLDAPSLCTAVRTWIRRQREDAVGAERLPQPMVARC
jgi:hypothetical protein